jgi:hypothetical protein
MSTKYIVNNLSGQTLNGDLTINGNVVITGTTNTRPYKIYTALLRQSGGADNQSITSGDLTIGVTYQIISGSGQPWDFTNVGAPNNDLGTYFVATGTIPNEWGAGELEYNTGAPIVTVLENTIGNVWFVYLNDGQYTINCDLFIDNIEKLFLQSGKPNNASSDVFGYVDSFQLEGPSVYMTTKDFDTNTLSNGVLYFTPIEIRVYN